MNLLDSVEFEPRLSELKYTAAAERHVGAGAKCYVRVKEMSATSVSLRRRLKQ